MAIIPRALRPMNLLRRRALRKGIQTDSELFRLISLLLIGRPALVRRNAYRQGLRGSSRFWRTVAYGFIAGDIWRKLTVKEPDRLGVERLVEGQGVTVLALPRPTRRSRRRASHAS
jgi:hypothetical protein